MIDLDLLRNKPELIKAELEKRFLKEPDVDELIKIDEERRQLISEIDDLRSEQKKQSKQISKLEPSEKKKAIAAGKKIAEDIKSLAPKLKKIDEKFFSLVSLLPTFAHQTVPVGKSETDNKVDGIFGEKPIFDFKIKNHWQLAEEMDWLDTKKAAKISGSRFSYVKGDLVRLDFALLRFAMDELAQKNYLPMLTPTLVKEEAMYGAGMFPVDKGEVYHLPEDELYLIGTSEITLLNYHAKEVLDLAEQPIKYAGFTTNYRREAGTYGKDMHGLIRGHQFDKLEMFIFSSQEESWSLLDNELLPLAEGLLSKLGLHFRRTILATGDLPLKMQKTYDLEAWLPSENRYLEMASISNAGDFQARRLNIKYVDKQGAKRYAHTLNGTAITFSRFPVVILENFQEADGKVRIPEVLQPYMDNNEYLTPAKKET